jgi:hypothetical protein
MKRGVIRSRTAPMCLPGSRIATETNSRAGACESHPRSHTWATPSAEIMLSSSSTRAMPAFAQQQRATSSAPTRPIWLPRRSSSSRWAAPRRPVATWIAPAHSNSLLVSATRRSVGARAASARASAGVAAFVISFWPRSRWRSCGAAPAAASAAARIVAPSSWRQMSSRMIAVRLGWRAKSDARAGATAGSIGLS